MPVRGLTFNGVEVLDADARYTSLTGFSSVSGRYDSAYSTVESGSAAWSTVTGKLDSSAFQSYSGSLAPTSVGAKALNGFVNRTDSTIGMSSTAFMISGAYDFYTNGVKHTKSSPLTADVSGDLQLHFVYFDISGDLRSGTDAWSIVSNTVPVATVYRDGSSYAVADERHGYMRDRNWHQWAHLTIGTRYQTGGTTTFTNTTFSTSQFTIFDEDIQITSPVASVTACRLWYRSVGGASMRFETGVATPYKAVAGALQYDLNGTLTPVGVNNYVCSYVYATDDVDHPVYVVVGQGTYSNITNARAESLPAIQLSTAEWKLLYRAIYRQIGASTPTYIESADYRTVSTGPAIQVGSSNDHQLLTNRAATNAHPAASIENDVTNFNGLLTAADTNVQLALETLDDAALAKSVYSAASGRWESVYGTVGSASATWDTVTGKLDQSAAAGFVTITGMQVVTGPKSFSATLSASDGLTVTSGKVSIDTTAQPIPPVPLVIGKDFSNYFEQWYQDTATVVVGCTGGTQLVLGASDSDYGCINYGFNRSLYLGTYDDEGTFYINGGNVGIGALPASGSRNPKLEIGRFFTPLSAYNPSDMLAYEPTVSLATPINMDGYVTMLQNFGASMSYGTIGSVQTGHSSQSGNLVFGTSIPGTVTVTEKMRIDSIGYVGVGTTSPSAMMDVVARSDSSKGIAVRQHSESHSANLTEWQTSGGAAMSYVDASGWAFTPSSAPDSNYKVANKKYVDDSAAAKLDSSAYSSTSGLFALSSDVSGTVTSGSLWNSAYSTVMSNSAAWGTSGAAGLVLFPASYPNHGFTSGQVGLPIAKLSGGAFVAASADTEYNCEVVGLLASVETPSAFTLQQAGRMSKSAHGFTGPAVFLAVTGGLTDVSPSSVGQYVRTVARVIDSNTLEVVDHPAVEITLMDADQYVPLAGTTGISGSLVPALSGCDLGSAAHPWNHLYVTSGSLHIGNTQLSETSDGQLQASGAAGVQNIAKTIVNATTLYLSPTGDDSRTFAQAQNPNTPLFSPEAAMRLLGGYRIATPSGMYDSAVVTISAMPGTYALSSEPQNLQHPDGIRIQLIGTSTASAAMDITSANTTTFVWGDGSASTADGLVIYNSQFSRIDKLLLLGGPNSSSKSTRFGVYVLMGSTLITCGPLVMAQFWNVGYFANSDSSIQLMYSGTNGCAARWCGTGIYAGVKSYINASYCRMLDNTVYGFNSQQGSVLNATAAYASGNVSGGIVNQVNSFTSFTSAVLVDNGTYGIYNGQKGYIESSNATTQVISGNTTDFLDVDPPSIRSNITLHVATAGDDSYGYWQAQNPSTPVATPKRAFDLLADWRIVPGYTVTVSAAPGVYNMGSTTWTINHPDANRIIFTGTSTAANADAITSGNTTTLTWSASNVDGITLADNTVLNKMNKVYLCGGTAGAKSSRHGIYCYHGSGVSNLGSLFKAEFWNYGINCTKQSFIGTGTDCALNNNTYGAVISQESFAELNTSYFNGNSNTGVYASNASSVYTANSIISGNTSYGFYIQGAMLQASSIMTSAFVYNSSTGVYAYDGSHIYGRFRLSGCTTSYSPASGTIGNNNSYINATNI